MRRVIQSGVPVALIAAVVAVSGCTHRLGDFTILSSKNVSVTGNRGDRVKGESCMNIFLFIPIGQVDMKAAVDRAIESAGPGFDALEDVVLSSRFIFTYIWDQSCMIVEGTAVSTKGGKAMLDRPGVLLHSSLLKGDLERTQRERIESLWKSAQPVGGKS